MLLSYPVLKRGALIVDLFGKQKQVSSVENLKSILNAFKNALGLTLRHQAIEWVLTTGNSRNRG